MNKAIYLCLAHMSGREQEFIQEAFDTNWVVPLGPNVTGFEKDIKSFLGEKHEVAALVSGTSAIHLALLQLGVGADDEVLCQSFTFCASANPINYVGAQAVFIDSESETWNLCPQLLKEAIEDRIKVRGKAPKALIVVHLYGMPAMMDEILSICNEYGIPVIEDAAEAMGSRYKGKACGTLAHFGILSFNGNKMITTSGGGALICKTELDKQQTLFYATQARENAAYYQHEKIGYNYRMSNICAGIGRGQMTVLEEHISHHKMIHNIYVEAFADNNLVDIKHNPSEGFDSNFWLSTILLKNSTSVEYCISIHNELKKLGIETRPLWKPLHLQPVFANAPAYVNGVSEALFHRGLCLPSGPCVTPEDANFVASEIKHLLSQNI